MLPVVSVVEVSVLWVTVFAYWMRIVASVSVQWVYFVTCMKCFGGLSDLEVRWTVWPRCMLVDYKNSLASVLHNVCWQLKKTNNTY